MATADDRTPQAESRKSVNAGVLPQLVSVAEGYARWAPSYDHSPNPLLAREERYLLPVLAGLRKKRLLDVACGTGRWLEKLLPHIEFAAGVDVSDAMLRIANNKSGIKGKLVEGTGEYLPFRANVFDLVICSFALRHFPELGKFLPELARITTPGADIFVTDVHPAADALGWRVGFRDARAPVHIEVFPRSSQDCIHVFSEHSFKCVRQVPLWLGEPEKPIFAHANKSEYFENACRISSVICLQFSRLASPWETAQ